MNLAPPRSRDQHRRGSTLILAAIIAALFLTAVGSAQAAPSIAWAWGLNHYGALGNGETEGPELCENPDNAGTTEGCSASPVEVSKLSGVTAVAGGGNNFGDHGLALLENGTVMAWGDNEEGELGNGTTTNSDVPVPVCAGGATSPCSEESQQLKEVVAIAAGERYSLALLKTGKVVAWGAGGALGDGSTAKSAVPVEVSGLSGVTAIAASDTYGLAVQSGKVLAWGSNFNGQLGDGTTTASDVPVAVCALGTTGPCPTGPFLEGVTTVAAGENHSLALLSGGTVVSWGSDFYGGLGDGTETNSDVPVNVKGLKEVAAVSAGSYDSFALLKNGTVKAWGENFNGQLGDGSATGPEGCREFNIPCSKTPVAVSNLSGVTAITAGGKHSLALLSNGAVMAWGQNSLGDLGTGSKTGPEPCGLGFAFEQCSRTPVAVKQAGAVVKGIGASETNSYAFGPPPPPANLPEAGRCVKVATGAGKYSGAACLTLATKTNAKKYEWTPASAIEKLAFSGSGLETKLTTAGHSTIKCIATNIGGEWMGPKTASVNVEFQGCYNAQSQQCQTVTNPQNKSEIKLNGVAGELGYIKYEEVEGKVTVAVGLDLKPQPPMTQFAEYECTGSTEAGHLEGSVIGKIMPISKMTTESKLAYTATKSGEQRPEAFQGSPKDTLITSFTSGTEAKGSGASSLNIKEYKGQNAAPVEIKAR